MASTKPADLFLIIMPFLSSCSSRPSNSMQLHTKMRNKVKVSFHPLMSYDYYVIHGLMLACPMTNKECLMMKQFTIASRTGPIPDMSSPSFGDSDASDALDASNARQEGNKSSIILLSKIVLPVLQA